MSASVVCEKTRALGWNDTKTIFDYIENIKKIYK